jgi:hypothetical protein
MSELWGPISATEWRSVPCTVGRPACEADVVAGSAVFYVQGASAAASMSLPSCAIQSLEDGSEQPVVIIQAELAKDTIVLGVRPLSGGNGICTSAEVRLLPAGFES